MVAMLSAKSATGLTLIHSGTTKTRTGDHRGVELDVQFFVQIAGISCCNLPVNPGAAIVLGALGNVKVSNAHV